MINLSTTLNQKGLVRTSCLAKVQSKLNWLTYPINLSRSIFATLYGLQLFAITKLGCPFTKDTSRWEIICLHSWELRPATQNQYNQWLQTTNLPINLLHPVWKAVIQSSGQHAREPPLQSQAGTVMPFGGRGPWSRGPPSACAWGCLFNWCLCCTVVELPVWAPDFLPKADGQQERDLERRNSQQLCIPFTVIDRFSWSWNVTIWYYLTIHRAYPARNYIDVIWNCWGTPFHHSLTDWTQFGWYRAGSAII